MYNTSQHSFHIPVMGLSYTIDSPIKVARFGISSVISIIEDRLIEMMRRHYYPAIKQPYYPISTHEVDYRAKRITDYLNLVNTIVHAQVEKLRGDVFETGSEIAMYFELLPEGNVLKRLYLHMNHSESKTEKDRIAAYLRKQVRPGNIDVNIMTRTDKNNYNRQGELLENSSDAVAALRGFANSELCGSSVVFSAGMNPRLYNYLESCSAFDPDEDGNFDKKIIVKVSDFRSALVQGKYLAKKGRWVSEFRIESGLNCGGHTFATEGHLMGPILEEFKAKRQELAETLFEIYNAALLKKGLKTLDHLPEFKFSVQGGIGTHEEDLFLHEYYNMESTGWGTPFLLVPEATTVDDHTLQLLSKAGEKDIVLSRSSPLGARFHYLKGTTAEKERLERIQKGRPGSPCTEKHLAFNTEFTTEPICTASRKYQELKLAQLKVMDLPEKEYHKQTNEVLEKECLCVGLSNAAANRYEQPFVKNLKAVTICPGPNIVHFNQVVTLQTMVDHIYGRKNILCSQDRPHMFIAELNLYIDYLGEQLEENKDSLDSKKKNFYFTFFQNLQKGIAYYRRLEAVAANNRNAFTKALYYAGLELDALNYRFSLEDKNESNTNSLVIR